MRVVVLVIRQPPTGENNVRKSVGPVRNCGSRNNTCFSPLSALPESAPAAGSMEPVPAAMHIRTGRCANRRIVERLSAREGIPTIHRLNYPNHLSFLFYRFREERLSAHETTREKMIDLKTRLGYRLIIKAERSLRSAELPPHLSGPLHPAFCCLTAIVVGRRRQNPDPSFSINSVSTPPCIFMN